MLTTTVLQTGPARHDMCGQSLPPFLTTTAESISAGLAKRLHNYALDRLDGAGFKEMCKTWPAEVYTLDADHKPADRSYTVRFKNTQGGYIEVIGILTRKGWPTLDHGLDIGQER